MKTKKSAKIWKHKNREKNMYTKSGKKLYMLVYILSQFINKLEKGLALIRYRTKY